MPDDREAILSRVRDALAPLPRRAAAPEYDPQIAVQRKVVEGRDPLEAFRERLTALKGVVLTEAEELAARLRAGGWTRGYCDPELWPRLAPYFAGFQVETEFDRARVDDYAFGITRAAGAVAENGTVVLDDATTSRRLGALAPWVHVAVVFRDQIHRDVPAAVAALGSDPNVVWCTGPSRTADVEGILIVGVHGPGVQMALVLD